jgi:uncharacterized DUF497 family protein
MRYEWDEAKIRLNFIKHGLDFSDAAQVFTVRCVTFADIRFDYGEERFISLGTLADELSSSSMRRAAPTSRASSP